MIINVTEMNGIQLGEVLETVAKLDSEIITALPTTQSCEFIPAEDKELPEKLKIRGEELTFAPHGFTQYLAKLAIPQTYWDKVQDLDLKSSMILEAAVRSALMTFIWHNQTIIGVLGSSTRPLTYLTVMEALLLAIEDCPHFSLEDIQVERCILEPTVLNLRCVIPKTKVTIGKDDDYYYGFHIQVSQVKSVDTVVAPMLYRTVCSNGLIDVRSQNTLVKQRSLSIAKDALAIVFSEMFDWIEAKKSGDIIERLNGYAQDDTMLTFSQVNKYLTASVAKLSNAAKELFLEDVAKGFPTGFSATGKVKMEAYSFFQCLTNSAQRLPLHYQVQIERNVAQILSDQ